MDWWKKKKKEKKKRALLCRVRGAILLEDVIKCCDGKSNPIKFFSADLIIKATNNFSDSNHLSQFQSKYWDWYSGGNDKSRMILIKKKIGTPFIYWSSEFYRDVAMSSMVSGHKNFMKLAGFCVELEYLFMVYYGEKEQYSSLDLEKIVSWKRRMKIAEDIAIALAYLHTAFARPFIYRILNTKNILIDKDGVAKLTDLSCCISIPLGETFVEVDDGIETADYYSEFFYTTNIVSEKTDANGFGMFMLMLLMGRRLRFNEFENKDILDEIVDRNMLEDMGEVTDEERCRMNSFLLLSLRCRGHKGEVPTMTEVAKELKKIQRSSQNAVATSSSSFASAPL